MQYALFSLQIRSGCGQDARAFLEQLEWERKSQYAASEQRLGITKELWAIQDISTGVQFVVFFQSPDIAASIGQFVSSGDEFDQWFKQQVKRTTEVDLNVMPPGPLSEIISVYEG
jgi:hypothetical protein